MNTAEGTTPKPLDGIVVIDLPPAGKDFVASPLRVSVRDQQTGEHILTVTRMRLEIDPAENVIIAETVELCGPGGKSVRTKPGHTVPDTELFSAEYNAWLFSSRAEPFEGEMYGTGTFRYAVAGFTVNGA